MKQRYLERTSVPISLGRARFEQTADSRMTRSQVALSTTRELPLRASSSSSRISTKSNARASSERLTNWMARSSTTARSSASRAATPKHIINNDYGKPTKTSLLRSKTCRVPFAQPDLAELHRKQKMFALRCKTYSSSSVSYLSLPDGDSLHGFLTGARYNSARTLDTNSLERYGVCVSKRNISNTYSSRGIGSRQLQKKVVFGGETSSEQQASVQEIQSNTNLDSTASIERELNEVFGPNQDDSSSTSESSFLETGELKSEECLTSVQSETVETFSKDEEQCDVNTNLETKDAILHSLNTETTSEYLVDQSPTFVTSENNYSDQTRLALSCDPDQKTSRQDNETSSLVSVLSSSNEFDREDEFISQEARKLTLEILEAECRNHASSLVTISSSSIGNITNIADSTGDMIPDVKEEESKQDWNHLSTDNIEISHSHVLLSSGRTDDSSIAANQCSRRVKSAGSNPVRQEDSDVRPISCGLYSKSLFIDMSSLS